MRPARALFLVLLPALLAGAQSTPTAPPPAGYAVRASFPLDPARDGTAGRIELLEDARIRPAMREPIVQSYGGDPCAERLQDTALRPLCAAPRQLPLRPALLRVVNGRGHVVASQRQARPLAELTVEHLYGDARPTYLVTVDLSGGMGSYSGPATALAEVRGGKLVWLTARDAGPRDAEAAKFLGGARQVTLAATLKTGWRLVPRADGAGQDIFIVACRPDFDAESRGQSEVFTRIVERITFADGRWVRHARREPGCWEAGDDFPAPERFPY